MKFLFDLFPVILFFLTYKLMSHGDKSGACFSDAHLPLLQEPILVATIVAIAATFLQVAWLLARRKKVDSMLWLSLGIISVFGGATLYFHNATFIQWKPTILYWLLAAFMIFSNTILKKNQIQEILGEQISLPETIWQKLNLSWILFMVFMGVANLVAMRLLSCDGWVSFKAYGLTAIMFIFVIIQSFALSKFIKE